MRVIGITGGIGSGKSYISRLLCEYFDIPVFNCDIEAHRLMIHETDLREELIKLVGRQVYKDDGLIDKAVLADYMFMQGHVNEVNAIVHPAVRRWFGEWKEIYSHMGPPLPINATSLPTGNEAIVAIESAIMIEAGFTDLCDELWLVTAPLEMRISRSMARDNATHEQIQARIDAQITDSERIKYASHVINNDETGNILETIKQLLDN